VIESDVPPNSTQELGNGLLASSEVSNMCEGWNNNFFNLVGHAHPSIWRVIEWCQKEEATVRTIIQQDAVGN
jgi:hypothetical protein